MNKRASPVRITMQEVIRLNKWLEDNQDTLKGKPARELAILATPVVGRQVSESAIYKIAKPLGYDFTTIRKPDTKLRVFLRKFAVEVLGADHDLIKELDNI